MLRQAWEGVLVDRKGKEKEEVFVAVVGTRHDIPKFRGNALPAAFHLIIIQNARWLRHKSCCASYRQAIAPNKICEQE